MTIGELCIFLVQAKTKWWDEFVVLTLFIMVLLIRGTFDLYRYIAFQYKSPICFSRKFRYYFWFSGSFLEISKRKKALDCWYNRFITEVEWTWSNFSARQGRINGLFGSTERRKDLTFWCGITWALVLL